MDHTSGCGGRGAKAGECMCESPSRWLDELGGIVRVGREWVDVGAAMSEWLAIARNAQIELVSG